MKYIFTLLNLLFLQVLSLNVIKPKLCINCKYFITDNVDSKFGKCSLFTKEDNENIFNMLVNGINENKIIDYYYCSTSRQTENMCGKEGKMYKRKYFKKCDSLRSK